VPWLTAFENRLRAVSPYVPVTVVLVAVNIVVFALMALNHQRAVHFNPDILVHWGADYAPKTFAGDWWRPLTSTFVHGGLGHLAGNLFFLLLIGPLVERLLGSARFAVVYLFAGFGAALLALGASPAVPGCGASGAVYGVYGAFLGCYLRGLRAIPAGIFLRSVGLFVLFALVNLLLDYMEEKSSFVAHLAGLVFGFAGGLLFGHVLGPRKTWDKDPGPSFWRPASFSAGWRFSRSAWLKLAVFSLVTILCCGLLLVTASVARRCSREAVAFLAPRAAAVDRERELISRFEDALDRWEDGDLQDAELQRQLEVLIFVWERSRTELKLNLPAGSGLENGPLSVRQLMDEARQARPRTAKDREPLSEKDYDLMYKLYWKLRVDNWRTLADGLTGDDPNFLPLVDEMLIMGFRLGLDEMANAQNPLGQWARLGKHRRHDKPHPGPPPVKRP
jgi:membrane associated rhomboid family serine protease